MSTEHTPAISNNEPGTNGGAPTYTPEQQAHIDGLIDKAIGKNAAKIRQELVSEMTNKVTDLQAKLDAAEAKANKPSGTKLDDKAVDELRSKLEEAERQLGSKNSEMESYKTTAREADQRASAAEEASKATMREVAMNRAMTNIPFFDRNTVVTLTKDGIQWDADRKEFVVKNENGNTRMDSTLEKPLSLEAFFAEFASKNKYLVKADLVAGAGSTDGSRSDLNRTGRYEVTDIFGPKSEAAKASDLIKRDPTEYHRLKVIAKQMRLIA